MFTKIECGECGGAFAHDYSQANPDHAFICEAGHQRHRSDFLPNIEEGESLIVRDGVLGYVTEGV